MAEAMGIDCRQFNANSFRSAEFTTPSAVKSPPDHAAVSCRQLRARLFKSIALTDPSKSESPAKYDWLNTLWSAAPESPLSQVSIVNSAFTSEVERSAMRAGDNLAD